MLSPVGIPSPEAIDNLSQWILMPFLLKFGREHVIQTPFNEPFVSFEFGKQRSIEAKMPDANGIQYRKILLYCKYSVTRV